MGHSKSTLAWNFQFLTPTIFYFSDTHNHHYTETCFIFTVFASMSRSRSIDVSYLWDLFFIFSLIFIVINHKRHLKEKKRCACFCTFFRMSYFWIKKSVKKANNFEIKFNLRVLLSFWLVFYKSQPSVAYKSVAYKKKRVTDVQNRVF